MPVLARLADLLFALPTFLLAFLVIGVAGPQVAPLAGGAGQSVLITAVFAAFGWPGLLRFVRSLVLSLKEQQYIEAARAMGTPRWQILSRHILPATWGLVLVQASFGVGAYMGFEATLSVLGLEYDADLVVDVDVAELEAYERPGDPWLPAVERVATRVRDSRIADRPRRSRRCRGWR